MGTGQKEGTLISNQKTVDTGAKHKSDEDEDDHPYRFGDDSGHESQSDKLSASDLMQTDQDNIPDPVTLNYRQYGNDGVSSEEDKTDRILDY